MDKKNFLNTAIGASLIAAAIGLFLFDSHRKQQEAEQYAREHPTPAVAETAPATSPAGTAVARATAKAAAAVASTPAAPEQILTLTNGTLKVDFTTHGAGIKTVALLGHAAELGKDAKTAPVLFNEFGKIPALALSFPDAATGKPAAWLPSFTVKEKTDTHLVLVAAPRADGLVVTREFTLADAKAKEPHLLQTKTTFTRVGAASAAPVFTALNLGTLPPTEADAGHRFLNVSAYDGDNYEVIGTDKFKDSKGFLGIGAHTAVPDVALVKKEKPFSWFATSNQFFAGITILDEKSRVFSTGMIATPVALPNALYPADTDGKAALTVTAEAGLDLGVIAPGESKTVSAGYFVGPKEYKRLSELGDHEDEVVQFIKLFGFISVNWLCKFLMTGLSLIHAALLFVMPSNAWNWGIAIVLLTVLVKAATWPLTGFQLKAAENMKKLQGPMKELKEKYKDNPQKLQQETMKLYREHRINPVAGCFPVLIQIPIFTGLYTAFQTTAELRHQPFLWFHDLSIPDVVPGIPHLHILPILMGVMMLWNMRMTPMAAGTDPNQKTIMYVMMGLFPIMCYTMPAGLTTYYTVNNSLTVLQSWLLKRKRAALAAAEAPGTVEIIPPVKNKSGKAKKA